MEQDNKISVVINTYNAEQFLARVLETVKDFDEIVVCDMESTDSTREIARRYGCRIVTFPRGSYRIAEPARNFAIQSATHKWVLVVDADELVTPELRAYLYNMISQPDCPQGLWIPRRNRFMNVPDKGRLRDHQLRFFVREGTVWPPEIHTMPEVQGRVEKLQGADRNVCFIHLDPMWVGENVEKANRYSEQEVVKRSHKNYGAGALLWRPAWRFFKSYVMNGDWREGTRGFISSVLAGFYQFLIVAKMIEGRQRKKEERAAED